MAASMIRLNARNDHMGRPRRVYVLIRSGAVIRTWNEGYKGYDAVPTRYRRMALRAPMFATTPREYRDLLREEKNR